MRKTKSGAENSTLATSPAVYSDTFHDSRYPGLEFEEGYIYAVEWPAGWGDPRLAGRGAEVEYFQEGENALFRPGARTRFEKFRPLTGLELEKCRLTGLLWIDRGFGPRQESVSRIGWDASVEREVQKMDCTIMPKAARDAAQVIKDLVKQKTTEVAAE